MGAMIYYLPGRDRSVKIEDVRAAGLGYAFEGGATPAEMQRGGPDGSGGVLLFDPAYTGRMRYDAEKQTWRKIPKINAWCGYETDAKPGPNDLVRKEPLPGRLVKLADGNEWLCPVARGASSYDEGRMIYYDALPASVGLNDDGDWTRGERKPAHDRLWKSANDWWDQYMAALNEAAESDAKTATFDFAGLNDAALTALATNYRVGKCEVVMLGLFDDATARDIMGALVDLEGWHELIKKKDGATGSGADGPPDGGTGTDRP